MQTELTSQWSVREKWERSIFKFHVLDTSTMLVMPLSSMLEGKVMVQAASICGAEENNSSAAAQVSYTYIWSNKWEMDNGDSPCQSPTAEISGFCQVISSISDSVLHLIHLFSQSRRSEEVNLCRREQCQFYFIQGVFPQYGEMMFFPL